MENDPLDAVSKALRNMIGENARIQSTATSLTHAVEAQMDQFKEQGLIQAANVDARTAHSRKNWKGRVQDWFVWKTPLHKWLAKPYWEEVDLADVLLDLHERMDAGVQDELIEEVRGIKLWEKKWPSNPYKVWDITYDLLLHRPIEFVKLDFSLKDSNAEDTQT